MRRALYGTLFMLVFTALAHAGYVSTLQEFSPNSINFVYGIDQTSFVYLGPGFAYPVTGLATGSLELAGNLGCTSSDFSGFAAGGIALISRGGCGFNVKGINAGNAGAIAFIVYDNINESLTGAQFGFFLPGPLIPGVFVTQSAGLILLTDLGIVGLGQPSNAVSMQLSVSSVPEPSTLALCLSSMLPAGRFLVRARRERREVR